MTLEKGILAALSIGSESPMLCSEGEGENIVKVITDETNEMLR